MNRFITLITIKSREKSPHISIEAEKVTMERLK